MERLTEFAGNHPFLVLALFVILGLLIGGEIRRATRKYKEWGPQQIVPVINRDESVILDVRQPEEFREGHIAGARQVPMGELGDQLGKLARFKDKPVVVYCQTGSRSARACSRLVGEGFEDVYNLAGGIRAWQSDKLPVKKK